MPPLRVSAKEAIAHIQSNSNIYLHSVANFPRVLVNQLASRAREGSLTNTTLFHLHIEGTLPFEQDDLLQKGRSHHFFIGKQSRKAVNQGHGTYLPVFLSEIPRLMHSGRVPIDYTLLNVSLPDKHGYCSLGMEVCAARDALECTSRAVIAQLNPNIPRTLGHSSVHIDRFDYVVEVSGDDAKLPVTNPIPIGEDEMQIGRLLAEMIPDGACLQVGIGAIPNAVLECLKGHKNLGVHSEMISDGVMELIKSGAVNNRQKSFLVDRTVSSFLVGSQALYDFVDDNPSVFLESARITNDPSIIARNKNVVAINSAIEVDLTGQVCADSVGTTFVSGIGGQLDFERGAALSQGGFPIICLKSRTRSGASTIVSTLKSGAGVTTSRYHAHWIVTEYGKVDLWGMTMSERAKALINIAAPEHREELSKLAYERFSS